MTLSAPSAFAATRSAQSLGQWAERRLRLAIMTGELAPGSRIAPSELAATWDISVTPLREAIHRLAAEGLVEEARHRGSRVRPMTAEDLEDLYELRMVVEVLALEKSLAASDDDHRAEMTRAHDRWAALATDTAADALTVEEAHRDFHTSLLSRCRSAWLLNMIDTLSHHSARYRILARATGRGGPEVAAQEHLHLLEACLEPDVELAVARLRSHLELTLSSLVASGKVELTTTTSTDAP